MPAACAACDLTGGRALGTLGLLHQAAAGSMGATEAIGAIGAQWQLPAICTVTERLPEPQPAGRCVARAS